MAKGPTHRDRKLPDKSTPGTPGRKTIKAPTIKMKHRREHQSKIDLAKGQGHPDRKLPAKSTPAREGEEDADANIHPERSLPHKSTPGSHGVKTKKVNTGIQTRMVKLKLRRTPNWKMFPPTRIRSKTNYLHKTLKIQNLARSSTLVRKLPKPVPQSTDAIRRTN